MKYCPGYDFRLIQVLILCQSAWFLAWLISCCQAFNNRLQVIARFTNHGSLAAANRGVAEYELSE
ncbi:hypothetical protein DM283_21950 [Shigella boydii]|nr:hypothetical protein [Shigella boydii]EFX8637485.1 hypothetical protein [Shigella boydii]EGE0746820.1 hypothetical protein [Shigella boydii]EGE3417893.1 hypothetical protein [Shigella boydii]ODJ29135.1 hypothetical protein BFR11_22695 [Shigella sp. FC2383]